MVHYLTHESASKVVCSCGREFSAHELAARTTVYLDAPARERFNNLNRARATRHTKAANAKAAVSVSGDL